MAFLREVKRCSKLDRIQNEAITEGLQVVNYKITNNGGKNTQKEYQIQDRPNNSGNVNLQDADVCADPGKDGWRVFEGGTGTTLPMPSSQDDDDDRQLAHRIFFEPSCLLYTS